MELFETDIDDADLAYRNIRAAKKPIEHAIRTELEDLWSQYEPYADRDFPPKFARDPDSHFWEMYLTTELLNEGKKLRTRASLETRKRELGPDICILGDGRRVWIEAVSPEPGEEGNPDRIPQILPISEGGGATIAPRRQVELRISSALFDKARKIAKYKKQNIISPEDICVVAISGAKFIHQSYSFGLPVATTVVYPIGQKFVSLQKGTGEIVDSGYLPSERIDRSGKESIPRYAFLDDRFSGIAGIIWSRRSIGNFLGSDHDFVFVHNLLATKALPESWLNWHEEYVVTESNGAVELSLATS